MVYVQFLPKMICWWRYVFGHEPSGSGQSDRHLSTGEYLSPSRIIVLHGRLWPPATKKSVASPMRSARYDIMVSLRFPECSSSILRQKPWTHWVNDNWSYVTLWRDTPPSTASCGQCTLCLTSTSTLPPLWDLYFNFLFLPGRCEL